MEGRSTVFMTGIPVTAEPAAAFCVLDYNQYRWTGAERPRMLTTVQTNTLHEPGMFQGKLLAIYIGATKAGPMHCVATVQAVAGVGLIGDRYGDGLKRKQPEQEVTLIESEAIDAAVAQSGLDFGPHLARRNLITRGVPLNHLVDRTFKVGSVTLRGIELCEPCGHLEKLTVKGIRNALVHRGGLRAQVLEGGTITAGDQIEPIDEA
jgi:MOSC domain-containing protein YiiM